MALHGLRQVTVIPRPVARHEPHRLLEHRGTDDAIDAPPAASERQGRGQPGPSPDGGHRHVVVGAEGREPSGRQIDQSGPAVEAMREALEAPFTLQVLQSAPERQQACEVVLIGAPRPALRGERLRVLHAQLQQPRAAMIGGDLSEGARKADPLRWQGALAGVEEPQQALVPVRDQHETIRAGRGGTDPERLAPPRPVNLFEPFDTTTAVRQGLPPVGLLAPHLRLSLRSNDPAYDRRPLR